MKNRARSGNSVRFITPSASPMCVAILCVWSTLVLTGCASFGAWRQETAPLAAGWQVRDSARAASDAAAAAVDAAEREDAGQTDAARAAGADGAAVAPDTAAGAPGPLQAGAARVAIALPDMFPLAGYGDRLGTYAEGAHDASHVRVCALSDGQDTVVIVSLDLVAVTQELFDAVLSRVREVHPRIGREDLLLTATHTHSGVGGIGHRWLERLASGHFDQRLFDAVVEAAVSSVNQSLQRMEPAALVHGEVLCPSLIVNRMEKDGLIEPRLRAVKVLRLATDQPLAIISQWSAHATILGRKNQLLSGDYPAAFTARLEASEPGSVAMMLTGPLGDQAPARDHHAQDPFEQVEAYAGALAESFAAAAWGPPVHTADVRSVDVMLDLPTPRVRMTRPLFQRMTRGLVRRQALFHGVRVGDWMLFGVPGEPTAEVGQALEASAESSAVENTVENAVERAAAGAAAGAAASMETVAETPAFLPWIVGLSNGYIGYIVSERQYALDAYESRMSSYGPQLAAFVEHTVTSLCEELTPEVDTPPPVVRLSGSPYDMGLQHGRQNAEAVAACYAEIFDYFEHALPLPMGRRGTMLAVLDSVWRAMSPHVPERYHEELRGLADGSGVPLRDVRRMHALAEVSATCSSFAVFGTATVDGRLIQSRNLDWNIRAGAQRYSRVFVCRPENGRPFVSVGFAGFVGVLSGVNAEGISVGEIGARSAAQTYRGIPMPFLLRRVLEESGALDEAVTVVRDAPRTRGYNYVIGSSRERRAVALETNREQCAVFGDEPGQISDVSYAVPVTDAVFRADTAMDPAVRERQWASRGNPCRPGLEPPDGSGAYEKRYKAQGKLIQQSFGRIDAPVAMDIARAAGPPSNIHSIIYDFPDVYVATARGATPAVKRRYHRFDVQELLK